jgi:hypothetical protein
MLVVGSRDEDRVLGNEIVLFPVFALNNCP